MKNPAVADSRESLLDHIFSSPLFHRHDGLSPSERHQLTYRRIRFINESFPLDRTLPSDPDRLYPLLERAAVADPALFHALSVHLCVGMASLVEFGADDEHLEGAEKLRWFATILVTEIGRGASHVAVRTEARYDAENRQFILHTPDDDARKSPSHVAAPDVPKLAIVIARLRVGRRDHGVFPFSVPIRDETGPLPGIRITPLPDAPLLPLDFATVTFDHVRVPFGTWLADGATLTPEGRFHDTCPTPDARLVRTLSVVPNMQAAVTAALTATTKAGVGQALQHACTRTSMARLRPGLPIIRYRTVQQPLFDALATTYAMSCLAESVRRPGHQRTSATTVAWAPWTAANRDRALAKVWTVTAAEQVADTCRRYGGAQGFISSRFLEYQALAHANQSAAGDNRAIMLDSARSMIDGVDYTPPASGLPSPTSRDLLDSELWRHLLRSRESELYQHLRQRLSDADGADQDEFSRWNDSMPLALRMVEAHLDRVALERMLAGNRRRSTWERCVTDPLCAYFAVRRVADHTGWYLCAGMLSTEQARSLDDALLDLCRRNEPLMASMSQVLG